MSGHPRLVIEVNNATDYAFGELVKLTGDTKSTIANRAVQLYLDAERRRRHGRGPFAWMLRRWYR